MDTKAAFDREAFEVWVTDYPDMRIDECAMTETLWQAWRASRAAIDKYAEPYKAKASLDLDGIAAALHAYGIKVKGKTE